MEFSLFEKLVMVMASAVLMLIVMRRLQIPVIIGYLLLGVLFGPHGMHMVSNSESIHALAEFGIVFLLFAIGLEVSLSRIIAMRRAVLWVGSIQVIACMVIPGITAYYLGMSLGSGFVAAAALSLSSTAIVVKQLSEQKELMTQHGELSFALLLFQDLAAIPFLICIPMLAAGKVFVPNDVLWIVGKSIFAVGVLWAIGRFILRPLFDEVAKSGSDELFTLTTLLTVIATAWLTSKMGLSMALGAFLAGLVLAETHHRHQIKKDIRPFRDLLLGLFFMTVGMLLDFDMIFRYWYWVLFLVGSILFFKTIVVSAVAKWVGHLSSEDAFRTGLILAHGGEFGFVLLTLAMTLGVMEKDYGQVVLAGILITLFLCPILIKWNGKIAQYLIQRIASANNGAKSI
ncbi:MAG: cation:proton antiporter [Gammaproteobacteria bacterium]